MSVDVENSDNFRVEMIPTDAVKTVGYSLFDVYSEKYYDRCQSER